MKNLNINLIIWKSVYDSKLLLFILLFSKQIGTLPYSKIFLTCTVNEQPALFPSEIQDWLIYRAEIVKQMLYVADSPYIFYSLQSKRFTVRGIQTMIEGY
ncbi:hypothetical protein V7127_02995 [Bacillus sp. JJ1773]|uniref:hypothetical protein n=1 Tax=Bacillus sp. JJ1773 TaxID=3122965 RepID=UPI002FFEBA1C